MMGVLKNDDPISIAITGAIQSGDLPTVERLLRENAGLAKAKIEGCASARSLLHIATDWPGNRPSNVAIVQCLIAAGADVDAPFIGRHSETALHWAASSDDVAVIDVLLDAGANIEAQGAVIAGGTPLSDAVAFGQWRAARRLLERGAEPTFREAAALGLVDRLHAEASPSILTEAFWYACHGGQLAAAQLLLTRGADPSWASSWDGLTPLEASRRSNAADVVEWLAQLSK